MKPANNPKSTPANSLFRPAMLLAVLLVAIYFISREVKYYTLNQETLGRFFEIRWWLMGHLSGGILALLIGPFQFWEKFRMRNLKLHRQLGKVYLIAILVATLCSTYMAWTSALKIHFSWALSLQVLAAAWLVTIFMAYRAIRMRRIQRHREWMIRSYIVTFGFISFRFINDTMAAAEMGTFVERASSIIYLVLFIPLAIAGLVFEWNRK